MKNTKAGRVAHKCQLQCEPRKSRDKRRQLRVKASESPDLVQGLNREVINIKF